MNLDEKIKHSEVLSNIYWFSFVFLAVMLVAGVLYLQHQAKSEDKHPIVVTKNAFSIVWNEVDRSGPHYIASKNGQVYYPSGCKSAKRIKPENRIYFASAIDASASGLRPAKNC